MSLQLTEADGGTSNRCHPEQAPQRAVEGQPESGHAPLALRLRACGAPLRVTGGATGVTWGARGVNSHGGADDNSMVHRGFFCTG